MISVIMGTYNEEEKDLEEAIQSILQQTYTEFEFIILLDNPGNKMLESILRKYEALDTRIKLVINEKNIGLAASLNKGIQLAQFPYIARMDADDRSFPKRFEIELDYLMKHESVDMVSANCVYMDEAGDVTGEKSGIPTTYQKIKKILPVGSSIIHPSILIKKEVLLEMGGYRALKTAEDYDLWLRMLTKGFVIESINEPLIYYRIRENSMTNSDKYLQYLMDTYLRGLYRERKKTGNDSFSTDHFEAFLVARNYYNQENKAAFEKANQQLFDALALIQQRKFGEGLKGVRYSFKEHKEVKHIAWNLAKYKTMNKLLN